MQKIPLNKKVKAIEVKANRSTNQLLLDMSRTGFQGRKLAEAVEVMEKMIKEKNLAILFGYAASMSTTGQWKIINWLMANRYIDILVSTGANISEDIVEAMGYGYYQGSHTADNQALFHQGLNRYYDVYGKESEYLKMTDLLAEFIMTLEEGYAYSSREFLYQCGLWLEKKGIHCIIATAAKHGVPVFCPAIADSPYGDAAVIAEGKGFHLTIDAMKDYVEFMRLGEKVKQSAAIYIGGGVPKDFIQLFAVTANLFYEDRIVPGKKNDYIRESAQEPYYPHKYALQITTDSPQWGSLSGCTFEEAVTWGKETYDGQFVQCYCDATIALPIVSQALAERIKIKRQGTDFSKFFKIKR